MTPEQLQRVEELFAEGMQVPEADRGAWLQRACPDDDAVRREVAALLNAGRLPDDEPTGAMRRRIGLPGAAPRAENAVGTAIGPYKVLGLIGEGGFGVVYLAERREPFVQRVALKLIKPGMDSGAVLARFEQERQALAVMNHPNVAKVLDAGTTEFVPGRGGGGLPFFVMEYVPGESITTYCDRHKLSIRQRLQLFIPVCEAVQHAHHKGIIHRDLKPSNILVSPTDAAHIAAAGSGAGGGGRAPTPDSRPLTPGLPKVIDFGVAKAVSHTLTEKTIFTEQGQLIGTPEYMSPEQAEMGATDIDTRTDVYSLGVVLYELLAGVLPFDPRTLRSKGYAEIQRIIREVEAPKPSTRLGALSREESDGNEPGASATGRGDPAPTAVDGSTSDPSTPPLRPSASSPLPASIAASRRTALHDLARQLKRELDWIPLKAIRKDRAERYATPMALAKDIQRYLDGEALEAGPESSAYRLRKLVKRNKGPVTAAAMVVVALAAGLAATLWQATEARRQAARADERALAAQQAESEQRRLAESERLARAEAQEQRTAAEKSAKAEKDRADELKQVSDFQANMLSQVDPTQAGVLLSKDVITKFEASLEKANVPESERAAQVEAFRNQWLRVNATDAARELIDRTILKPAIEAIDKQFKDQPVVDAQLRQVLADRYVDLGLFEAAFPLQEQALTTRRTVLGDEHLETLTSINNMGILLQYRGKRDAAEPYYREALEKRRRVLGEEHPHTLTSINNMGYMLKAIRKLDEAETYWREALEKRRRVMGEEHPHTLLSISNMGDLLVAQGKLDEAEPYLREAMEKRRRILGEEHPDTLESINSMVLLLRAQQKLQEAEAYCREGLDKRRRILGEEHRSTLNSLFVMGSLLKEQGKLNEAEPYYREALEKRRRVLGEEHPETLASIDNMGRLLRAQGKLDEAEPYYREALAGRRRVFGEDHQDTIHSINNLGTLLEAQGKLDDAGPYYREALEKSRRALGEEHPDTLVAINNVGFLLQSQGKIDEALELLAPAEPVARKAFPGANAWRFATFLDTLGRACAAQSSDPERFARAEANLTEAHTIFVSTRGESHKDARECAQGIIDLYAAWHAADPGKGYDAKAAEWQARLDALEPAAPDAPSGDK